MAQIKITPNSKEYLTNLPYYDGIPLETPVHREKMNILTSLSCI